MTPIGHALAAAEVIIAPISAPPPATAMPARDKAPV
jgi:hypothetical protein